MNKLDMKTKDSINENIVKIRELFPNVVVEINNGYAINFDALKQELSDVIIDEKKEKYELTWPGKKEAILESNIIETKTLRPVKEKSVDFDNTKNIYIEGDNLEALKILQESYLNKINCIYIDPPYNTGNDFIYNDNFNKDSNNELEESGQIDETGYKLVSNTSSNGRFHSDWLSMMYPRLKLARNLLSDYGAIFISIDDNEYDNLKKECDEIFGEKNHIATFIWQRAFSPVNLNKYSSQSHDYIVCYCKDIEKLKWYGLQRSEENDSRYSNPDNDPRGPWSSGDCSVGPRIDSKVYPIELPSGRVVTPPSGRCWRVTKDKFDELVNDNRIWFGSNGDGVPRLKRFLSDVKQYVTPMTVWTYQEVGHSQEAKKELNDLFDGKALFDYPKSLKLIERVLNLCCNKNSIILDFFSGSATTAHAVMQLNAEDGGNRKYIMIQLPELCDEKSEAYKEGYKTICDIGEERIRRAGKKIKEEINASIDYGFRVYKIDESNMKDEFYKPAKELDQTQLFSYIDNIKDDRSPEDLLTQVILDLGLTLDLKVEERQVGNSKIYIVDENSLVACFDENVSDNVVNEIANIKPLKVVFRDSSFTGDKDKINFEERLRRLSPDTEFNVL